MAHGVTITFAWLSFAAIIASLILYLVSGKYSMKAAPTPADTQKARQLAMAAFWAMVTGLILIFIAAVSASCDGGVGRILRGLRDRYIRSGATLPF